ncbi:hypothetical protein PCL_08988 [Purpureocillium lilacinum]|uniref:Uncharacterized protein n=1 Tax=Purpureocillium lilacinum TaxID=33203 RepID=A0A2U3EGW7_PURLI|nr:hypothetical protein PCL_08988 [Purpureocillium lilacinum]
MDGWVNGWMDGWDGVRALNEMERLSGLALLWTPGRSPRLAPPAVARVESSPHVPETHGGGPAKPKARNPGGREDADTPTHTHADFLRPTGGEAGIIAEIEAATALRSPSMASLLLGPGLLDWLAHREHGTDAGRIHFPDAPQKHIVCLMLSWAWAAVAASQPADAACENGPSNAPLPSSSPIPMNHNAASPRSQHRTPHTPSSAVSQRNGRHRQGTGWGPELIDSLLGDAALFCGRLCRDLTRCLQARHGKLGASARARGGLAGWRGTSFVSTGAHYGATISLVVPTNHSSISQRQNSLAVKAERPEVPAQRPGLIVAVSAALSDLEVANTYLQYHDGKRGCYKSCVREIWRQTGRIREQDPTPHCKDLASRREGGTRHRDTRKR